jgi:aspartate carbamoyltransferase regulatory subunit
MNKTLKVSAIKKGTVIDHIPFSKSLKVIKILDLPNNDMVMVGINFPSQKMIRKDVLKIENKFLSQDEVDKLMLVSPNATINIIENGKVIKKLEAKLPKIVTKVVKCFNPKCISYLEPHTLETKFYVVNSNPIVLKCHYCERKMQGEEIELN